MNVRQFNSPGLRTVTKDADHGSLGGGGPPDMTDKLERIEKRLDAIESDQRTHLRWLLNSFVGLVGLILASTGFVLTRIDRTEDRISRLDDRMGRLETSVSAIPAQVNQNLMQLTQTLAQAILAAQRPAPPPPPAPEPK